MNADLNGIVSELIDTLVDVNYDKFDILYAKFIEAMITYMTTAGNEQAEKIVEINKFLLELEVAYRRFDVVLLWDVLNYAYAHISE